MAGPPVVDYANTSARPSWRTLPEVLRRSLVVALGTEIRTAGPPVGSGFTGGFAAAVTLADGREVFVKAAPESLHAYRAYQREAEIVPQLPSAIRVPEIVATAHAADDETRWFAVISARIDGRMPGSPWTADDFAAVTATCETMASALTPSPLPGLKLFSAVVGDEVRVPEQVRSGDRPLPTGFQPWLEGAIPEFADLVSRYPVALAGDSATHNDLRPDNLLIDPAGRCWTVDWNWLALGPAWLDWAGLLPIAQHHGIDTAAAIRRSPLTADVPADDLDCFAAVIAAYMLSDLDAPPPRGCTPELRRHQRLYAWTFLDWLAARRGWC
ncbi:phosphotransferase family enzyme [Kribbella amoyensis]|uniref:Phosphotransferase family enzyme n=1 Tax=Kribbella amoyensis TaxID=996641 RepID=A0A561BY89_9ACTN|nr:phosphotransferase [Kribbella amoyensis]TWD83813.1 phosphotransferase family enzyme [Kribbella amoyensis]